MDRWRRPRRRPKAHRLTWDPRDYSPGAFFYWSLDGHALYRKAAARCLTFLFFFFLFRFFIFSGKRQVSRRHSTKPRRRTSSRPEYSWTKQHVQTLSMVSDSEVRASERYAEA